MAQLKQFAPPANQADLTGDDQTNLAQQWSGNVNRWTETAILGNPWGTLFDQNRDFYYNPLTTDVANKPISKPIAWTAFPNRILLLFPNATFIEQMGYAEGVHEDGTFGAPPNVQGKAYAPEGARGWQDEYCEWIATRDADGRSPGWTSRARIRSTGSASGGSIRTVCSNCISSSSARS
jgi:hypothetical protein